MVHSQCFLLYALALVRVVLPARVQTEIEFSSASDAATDRTLCKRSWQLERIFPTDGNRSDGYAGYAVRTFAGKTLDDKRFAAIRSLQLSAAGGNLEGGLQNRVFRLLLSGDSSCTEIGQLGGDCAVLHLTLADLTLYHGTPGWQQLDTASLPGETEVIVSARVAASISERAKRTGWRGRWFGGLTVRPRVTIEELYLNILKFGNSKLTNEVLRRAANSGVLTFILKQALSKAITGAIRMNTELLYDDLMPNISFSAQLRPTLGSACPQPFSCIELVDTTIELEASTMEILAPHQLNALLDKLGPLGLKLRQQLGLGPCCGEHGPWWLPSQASAAFKQASLWSEFSVGHKGGSTAGPHLAFMSGMDMQLSMKQLLANLRHMGGMAVGESFLGKHPEERGDWVTLRLENKDGSASLALGRPNLRAEGNLVLENTEVDGKQVVLVKLQRATMNVGIDGLDCEVELAYIKTWRSFNPCAVFAFTIRAEVSLKQVLAAVDMDSGEVSLCLQQPCGGRTDLVVPEVGIKVQALPVIPDLTMDDHGGMDVTINVFEMLAALNGVLQIITEKESLLGPFPIPLQVQEAVLSSMEDEACVSGIVAKALKKRLSDVVTGRNLHWGPTGETFAFEAQTRMEELELTHGKPGWRYLAGRFTPKARDTGVIHAVAWQDESIEILDAQLSIRPATRAQLDTLQPDLQGEYIVEVKSSTGGPLQIHATLLNPESSDPDLSNVFYFASAGGGWSRQGDGTRKFSLELEIQLTMVLQGNMLNGCLGGPCCNTSVDISNLKLGTSLATWGSGMALSILTPFLGTLVGRALPKLLNPVVDHALSAGVSMEGGFGGLDMQLQAVSELSSPVLRLTAALQPAPPSPPQPRRTAQSTSKKSTGPLGGLILGLDRGLVKVMSNPLKILAQTILTNLDFSVSKTRRQKLELPFKMSSDSALNVAVRMPNAKVEVLLRQLLKNMQELQAQPPLFWQDRVGDFGLPPMDATPDAGRCALRQPADPSQNRKLNRFVDFSLPFDVEQAISSVDAKLKVSVELQPNAVHKIKVVGGASVKMILDKILPTVANDPGSTQYFFADYSAGLFNNSKMFGTKQQAVRVACGWLAFDEKPTVDLLALKGEEPAVTLAGGDSYLVLGGYKLQAAEAVVRGLAEVLKQEASRQSLNQAVWADPECDGLDLGAVDVTAFGALASHITSAFRWKGAGTGLGAGDRQRLLQCQAACGAHPQCRGVRLVQVQQIGLPAATVCSYSPKPVSERKGITKDWLVRGAASTVQAV